MKALIPAVLQDARNGNVLMVAYMNEEALEKTKQSGFAWFYSRSRQCLWMKGETSGNRMKVVKMEEDCDADTLLLQVMPEGPACHTGSYSCFGEQKKFSQLEKLADVIQSRKLEGSDTSYTSKLLQSGLDRILKKIGEEAGEVIIAAKNADPSELIYESADWLYHWMVLLEEKNVKLDEVMVELARRGESRK